MDGEVSGPLAPPLSSQWWETVLRPACLTQTPLQTMLATCPLSLLRRGIAPEAEAPHGRGERPLPLRTTLQPEQSQAMRWTCEISPLAACAAWRMWGGGVWYDAARNFGPARMQKKMTATACSPVFQHKLVWLHHKMAPAAAGARHTTAVALKALVL